MANEITFVNAETGEIKVSYEGTIESVHLYAFLKRNATPKKALISAFEEALRIGGHALNLDSTSVLISEIEKNLEGRLSTIRQIYENRASEMKQSHAVGKMAETTFDAVLSKYSSELKYGDIVRLTGDNSQDGKVRGVGDRKLGDIEILIANSELRIAIESKYTGAGPAMGDLATRGNYKSLSIEEHAKGQVRGAQANRESHYAIFITKPGSNVAKSLNGNLYIDHGDMAIYVVADLEVGKFDDLKVAYMVARALTLSLEWPTVQQHHLRSVAALLIRSANKLSSFHTKLESLKKLGKEVTETATTLLDEYSEDKQTIDSTIQYLETVMTANNELALELKVLEIEKLTGQKLEIKIQDK